jgi:hypothetical protein
MSASASGHAPAASRRWPAGVREAARYPNLRDASVRALPGRSRPDGRTELEEL